MTRQQCQAEREAFNAISADWHEPNCCLVRYVEGGKTNEFHAWTAGMATVDIRPTRKKGLRMK